jgi:DNA-binding NarL/FixJ family response regulator
MSIRLAIVEGQTLTRYGLRALAAEHCDIEIVAESATMAQASRLLAAARPDVVTVAVNLPDGHGLQLASELRDHYADLGIVVLTSADEDDVLFRALETGVSAFVSKTAPADEILAAIRHAAVAASSFTASGLAVALNRRRTKQERLAISPREAQALQLLGEGLSIPAMARVMFISRSTAKTYVARLYEKLGVSNRAQALMTAVHYGLIHYGGDASLRVISIPAQRATEPVQPASHRPYRAAVAADIGSAPNWRAGPPNGNSSSPPRGTGPSHTGTAARAS